MNCKKERGAEWADGRLEREWDGRALGFGEGFGDYFDAGLPVTKSAPNPCTTARPCWENRGGRAVFSKNNASQLME
jgi:hypothetical protein